MEDNLSDKLTTVTVIINANTLLRSTRNKKKKKDTKHYRHLESRDAYGVRHMQKLRSA